MPRLTNQEYIKRHYFLKALWQSRYCNGLYGMLGSRQQWELHEYYVPYEDISDQALVAHRISVDKTPSLAQKAGKHFSTLYIATICKAKYLGVPTIVQNLDGMTEFIHELDRIIDEQLNRTTSRKEQIKRKSGNVRITAIVNPEPDIELLGRALISVASRINKDKKNKRS